MAASGTDRQDSPVVDMAPQTVMVVDDEPLNLKLLEAYLHSEPYRVIMASSGAEALALVGTHPPDLILLDALMPGLDGFAVARAIKLVQSMLYFERRTRDGWAVVLLPASLTCLGWTDIALRGCGPGDVCRWAPRGVGWTEGRAA